MATRPIANRVEPASWLTAGILGLLLVYGAYSTPGLVGRWGASLGSLAPVFVWAAAAALAWPILRERPSRGLLGLIALVGIALHIAVALLVVGRAPQGDAQSYLTLAANVRAGTGLRIADPFLGITTRAFYPPLYAVVLAGWSTLFGGSTWALLALSSATDICAAGAIVLIGLRIGKPGAGRAAAWVYLIWPSMLFSAPLAQKESLGSLLILLIACAWLWNDRAPYAWRKGVAIGVGTGLLALTQPGQIPLAGLIGLALATRNGLVSTLRIGMMALIVATVVLIPWWVRNALIFGRFVPLTTASGLGLWIGNNPEATGNWMPPPESLKGLDEIAYGRAAGGIAVAWITAHPISFLILNATKFVRSAAVAQAGMVRLSAMHPAVSAATAALLFPLSQATHLFLLGAGAVGARLRGDRGTTVLLLLVAACGVQLLIFGVWFEFAERHREFATPFLLLLAFAAVDRGIAGNGWRHVAPFVDRRRFARS